MGLQRDAVACSEVGGPTLFDRWLLGFSIIIRQGRQVACFVLSQIFKQGNDGGRWKHTKSNFIYKDRGAELEELGVFLILLAFDLAFDLALLYML